MCSKGLFLSYLHITVLYMSSFTMSSFTAPLLFRISVLAMLAWVVALHFAHGQTLVLSCALLLSLYGCLLPRHAAHLFNFLSRSAFPRLSAGLLLVVLIFYGGLLSIPAWLLGASYSQGMCAYFGFSLTSALLVQHLYTTAHTPPALTPSSES